MKSSRRWLVIFGLAIGVIIAVTVALVLATTSPGDETLLPEDTPEGTVQQFLLAVRDGDFLAAEGYISTSVEDKIDFDLRRSRVVVPDEGASWRATLGKSVVKGDEATVEVTVDVFRRRGPFENAVSTYRVTFFLNKEGTSWRITSPINLWWLY